jgi:hypothetical protein
MKTNIGSDTQEFPNFIWGWARNVRYQPVKLELIDVAKPYHAGPFPVPQYLKATTKTEVKRLTDIDVFNRSSDSEWAEPTFIQAKKTGDVRILTDFRRLNAQIRRKPFP